MKATKDKCEEVVWLMKGWRAKYLFECLVHIPPEWPDKISPEYDECWRITVERVKGKKP